uniref:Uncharacterized protein n=1 Tax=Anguilla anguilla TaxID=7936 RepID=A0A0E9WFX2_ANGAN
MKLDVQHSDATFYFIFLQQFLNPVKRSSFSSTSRLITEFSVVETVQISGNVFPPHL